MNIKLSSLIVFMCSVFFSCNHSVKERKVIGQDTIPVELLLLEAQSSHSAISVTGIFTTEDETLLGFKNGGVIQQVLVEAGDPIRKGQLLARIEATEIEAKGAQVKLGLEKAERDYGRAERLFKDSVATLEQLQNAKTALDVAKQDLEAIAYNQRVSELRSPVNGFVLAKLANPGQVVGPGTPVLQINGADHQPWRLKVGVSDRQWARIKIGDLAEVQSDALGNHIYKASVTKKSEGLDPQSGTFLIWLTLSENTAIKLASGVLGEARISAGRNYEGWEIPYDAFIEGDGMEGFVFITDDQRTAKKIKIKVASLGKQGITVVSGLEGIKHIIVSGSPYLVDGSPIKVLDKK